MFREWPQRHPKYRPQRGQRFQPWAEGALATDALVTNVHTVTMSSRPERVREAHANQASWSRPKINPPATRRESELVTVRAKKQAYLEEQQV